jgi:hypothetical protein
LHTSGSDLSETFSVDLRPLQGRSPERDCQGELTYPTASDVRVSPHESRMMRDPAVKEAEIRPNEAVMFMAVRNIGAVDSSVTVEWANSVGDRC